MAKNQGIDPKASTAARIRRTEAYAEKVRLLFAQTVNEILALNKTMPKLDDGVMFSFDGESMKKQKEVEALLRRLHSSVTMAIREGVSLEWAEANAEADKLVKSVFGQAVLDSPEFTAWTQRNTAARDAFLARSEKGLNLSDRVWKSVRQLRDELEVAVTVSMGEGKSASAMSREVRQYLNDPDLMFRRFRYKKGEDADGNPIYGRKWKKRVKDEATGKYKWIDYDRDSYPTGPGVYKSSAKNAMRLTRTETNIAYRRADHERWMNEEFVIGQRIQLSQKHPEKDICDKLQGDYPKDFVFDGWHPQCFCFATPILLPDAETDFMEKWFLEGKDWEGELKRRAEACRIKDYPDGFKSWVAEHAGDIQAARKRGTEPYFIRNNAEVIDRFMGLEGSKQGEKDIHDMLDTSSPRKKAMPKDVVTPPHIEVYKDNTEKGRRKAYERLVADDDYVDVVLDTNGLGLKATHKHHNFDSKGGKYEKQVQNAGFIAGHLVIFENERGGAFHQKFTEGIWDGMQFEVAGCETATSNNILAGLKHCASKKATEIAVLDFPNGGFDEGVLKRTIGRYMGLQKLKDGQFVKFKKIICVQNGKIVFETDL